MIEKLEDIPDPNSHSGKLALKNLVCLFLVYGYSELGIKQYSYVIVPGEKVAAFKKAYDSGKFEPGNFGKVISWGLGDPPPETMQEMEQKYGIDYSKHVLLPRDFE